MAGVAVTHRGHDGQRHGRGIQRPAGSTPANPATTPRSGMGGNGSGPFRRTARDQPNDLIAQSILEGLVINASVSGVAQSAPFPCLLIGQAGNLGLGERFLFDEDPLALIATPRATGPHHDPGKSTRLLGSPGEGRVTGRQEDHVVEICTYEA